ncbi:hypothetical protein P3T23_002388 [Paraburkholderia sp. GAS448]
MRGVNALTALTDNDFDASFGLSSRANPFKPLHRPVESAKVDRSFIPLKAS